MQWAKVPLSELVETKRNIRTRLDGIEELAQSIEQNGLLQNLIVMPKTSGGYEVVGGMRRLKALHLLVDQEKIDESYDVPVLIKTNRDDFAWVNTIENLQRKDVQIWEYGRRFNELVDAGHTQSEIAARVGKQVGYVSRSIQIATNIHPALLKRISELRGKKLTDSQLLQMAHIIHPKTLEPDHAGQEKYFKLVMRSAPRKPGKRPKNAAERQVYRRLQKLKTGSSFSIPWEYIPAIKSLVRYLEGETKTLVFRPEDAE